MLFYIFQRWLMLPKKNEQDKRSTKNQTKFLKILTISAIFVWFNVQYNSKFVSSYYALVMSFSTLNIQISSNCDLNGKDQLVIHTSIYSFRLKSKSAHIMKKHTVCMCKQTKRKTDFSVFDVILLWLCSNCTRPFFLYIYHIIRSRSCFASIMQSHVYV